MNESLERLLNTPALPMLAQILSGAALTMSVACTVPSDRSDAIGVHSAALGPPSPIIDARRSLAITDQPILVNFSLQRVLNQIVSTSGVSGVTALDVFHQWWDTQNPAPGLGLGGHCNDVTDSGGNPIVNTFPYLCRESPAEGSQASCDPFTDPGSSCAYIPIGLFMRFDLAPASGANCGEYRIVYAKATGKTAGLDRNLLIFEAALPNPHVQQGIRGCQKFVRAWAELSEEDDIDERREQLETFYFDGYQEFAPVVSFDNYGGGTGGSGQIRTNQFMQPNTPRMWSLREFKTQKQCSGSSCALRLAIATDKVNPFGPLFSASSTLPQASAFQTEFISLIAGLSGSTIGSIGMANSDTFNTAQSQASGSSEMDYPLHFGPGPDAFRSAIQSQLTTLGSTLTPDHVVLRAQAMSCAGCHKLTSDVAIGGGLTWPASLGFTHVSERDADLEVVGGVTRFKISVALTDHFLPHRKQIAEDYLNDVPLPPIPANAPIGGRLTH